MSSNIPSLKLIDVPQNMCSLIHNLSSKQSEKTVIFHINFQRYLWKAWQISPSFFEKSRYLIYMRVGGGGEEGSSDPSFHPLSFKHFCLLYLHLDFSQTPTIKKNFTRIIIIKKKISKNGARSFLWFRRTYLFPRRWRLVAYVTGSPSSFTTNERGSGIFNNG